MREHQLGIGEVEAANPDNPLGSNINQGLIGALETDKIKGLAVKING